jgi:Zn-dependent peptidase ImmA (M78 family)
MIVASDIAFDANNDPDDGKVDARFTLGHELGHGLSLGHTAFKALMYPVWPNTKYMGILPTANDIDGLQHAYGQP